MQKFYVIGASALALSAALASGTAFAIPANGRGVTASIADYNAAQVGPAGGILTVPAGLATYTVGTTTLETNSRFTVTLPPNFTFSSQPALTSSTGTTFTLQSGGIGTQSIIFTVGAPGQVGGTVSLSGFAVAGATALATPVPVAAALPISMQSTNNAEIAKASCRERV